MMKMRDPVCETARCAILGILDDGWGGLAEAARQRLRAARVVIGARRTLDLVAPHLPATAELRDMDGALASMPGWAAQALGDGLPVAVLATGDPLCHGIASFVMARLGAAHVDVLPAPSTLQLAFARLKQPWQDVAIRSCHSRDDGEWQAGATPAHGLYALLQAVREHPRVAAFTAPHNGPDRIARALLVAGHGAELRLSVAARLGLTDEAVFAGLTLEDAAARHFPDPNIVVIERVGTEAQRPVFGFDDHDYVQRHPDKGLITKLEARALSLAKLALRVDSVVWDIGAGAGSVGLEAARIAARGHVWAIEKNTADAANARENARGLRASNYTLVEGRAPDGLEAWADPDAVFVGGSGGELEALIALCLQRLKPGGRLVMNFVTIENLGSATATLERLGAVWDATLLSAARSQPILDMHRLAAHNPVWIVTAHKPLPEPECNHE
jgi:precorrin-6Y C5,15-methyltransferase (decarboxylating)